MHVFVENRQRSLKINKLQVQSLAEAVLKCEKQKADEVAICFVGTKEMCALHEHFFDDPSLTDCISFPIDDKEEKHYRVLGEVIVCPKVALAFVEEHGGDPYHETSLYIIHGILHLLGYDDIKEKDRKKMRAAEQRVIRYLKAKKLLLSR